MNFYDLAIRSGEKDGKTVIFLDQTLVDYSRETFNDQSIVLSMDQIESVVCGLRRMIEKVKSSEK